MLVIDASVALKWVIPEDQSDLALRVRRERCLAPDLLVPECANTFWKKAKRGEFTLEEADFAVRLLVHSDIELRPMRPLLARAVALSRELSHPAYDCFYLALAETLDCRFVTADRTLCRKAQPHAVGHRVTWLSDIAA